MDEIEQLITNKPLPKASQQLDERVERLFHDYREPSRPHHELRWYGAACAVVAIAAGLAGVTVGVFINQQPKKQQVRKAFSPSDTTPPKQLPEVRSQNSALAGIYRTHFQTKSATNAPVIVATCLKDPVELGAYMPYARAGNTLHVWDWSKSSKSRFMANVRLWPTDVFAVSPDGRHLVWADGRVLDLQSGTQTRKLDLGGTRYPSNNINITRIRSLQFSPSGKFLAVCINNIGLIPAEHPLRDNEIDNRIVTQLLDFQTGKKVCQFPAQFPLAFTPNGKHVIAAVPPQKLEQQLVEYSIDGGETVRTLESGITGHAYSIEVSPDGKLIAAYDGDAGLLVWDAKTAKLLHKIEKVKAAAAVTVMQFSPDGQLIALAGIPNVQVIDVALGTVIGTVKTSPAAQIRWSEDQKTMTIITGQLHYEGGSAGLYTKLMAVEQWDWRNGKLIESMDSELPK